MNVLIDGGPAFPGMWQNYGDLNATAPDGQLVPPNALVHMTGMSLRDYFIAHAPAHPQEWFTPVMETECPAVPSQSQLKDVEREAILRIDYSDDHPLAGWARQWCAARDEAAKGQAEWQAEFRKQLYVQWPAAWADEMLKARKR